jgi:hypothetical protein
MFHLKRINNEVVTPIKVPKVDPKDIKGHDLFEELYANVFLVAKKKSGKTNVVFKILKECSNKNTRVVIFSSTTNKDDNMKHIIEWLENKKMTFDVLDEIGDNLDAIIHEIENAIDDDDLEKEKKSEELKSQPRIVAFNDDDDEMYIRVRKYKPKKKAPEYMFIFDDISSDLKSPTLSKLLKHNRHYKSKVVISSQYPLDIVPQVRKQLDYWLVFKGQPEDKLKIIYNASDLNIPFEEFMEIYKTATEEKFHFLYIDTNNQVFRKDFNSQFEFSHTEM